MWDPDENDELRGEAARLDKLLSRLSDCDLSDWDATFVEDMTKRLDKCQNTIRITARQWEQLDRMEDKYLD